MTQPIIRPNVDDLISAEMRAYYEGEYIDGTGARAQLEAFAAAVVARTMQFNIELDGMLDRAMDSMIVAMSKE